MAQSSVATLSSPSPEAAADRLIDPLPDPSATAPAGPADGQTDDLLSQLAGAEIDRMLAAADVEPTLTLPPPVVVPPPVEPVAAADAAASAAASASPPVDLDAVLSAAVAGPAAVDTVPLDELAPDGRLPLWLRPLAVLSAPLDRCPDRVREAIGKAGLVTLINAVAVIAYVAFVRHHG